MKLSEFLTKVSQIRFLAYILAPIILTIGLAYLPGKDFARKADILANYKILLLNLVAIVVSLIFSKSDIITHFKSQRIKLWEYALSGSILILGTIILLGTIEPRHRVQSDESIFLATAQNMHATQKAGACDQGYYKNGELDCLATAANFKAKGFPFLLSLGIPFFGNHMSWAFNLQAIFYFISILLMIFAIRAWTGNALISFTGGAFLAFCPTILFQFRSLSVEPLYVLLSLAVLWVLNLCYHHGEKLSNWILLGSLIGIFAQTRQETVFCLISFGLIAIWKLTQVKKSQNALAFSLSASIFTIPILFTISHYRGFDFQGGGHKAHGFSNFIEHLEKNWAIMTQTLPWEELKTPFLGSFAWLAAFGLICLVISSITNKKSRIYLFFLFLYHLQTYMILENISGDFSIQINQRYALVFLPSLAFLIGFGLDYLWKTIIPLCFRDKPHNKSYTIPIVSILIILIAFSLTYRHRNEIRNNVMYKNNHLTNEEYMIHKWILKANKNPLFIYHRPWHFIGYGYSSIHYHTWTKTSESQKKALFAKHKVYYVRGMDCWDSKTYHKKAIENRVPKVCDTFEKENSLLPEHQKRVLNSYNLVIATIQPEKKINFDLNINNTDTATLLSYKTIPFNTLLRRIPFLSTTLNTSGKMAFPEIFSQSVYYLTPQVGPKVYWKKHYIKPQFFMPLGQIKPSKMENHWTQIQINKTIEGHRFKTQAFGFEQGIGMHAPSLLEYDIPTEFTKFSTFYGLFDGKACGNGSQFKISINDSLLLEKTIFAKQLEYFETNLPRGEKVLKVQTLDLGNPDCDHTNLLSPILEK